jgi:UDP-glucose 4-epimerase
MRILVTGYNGFIVQHLVRALLDAGYHVRGMHNSDIPLYFIKENEVEKRKADLRAAETIQGIATDIDVVFHLAAIPRNDTSKKWDDFFAINVNGTRLLLEECMRAGVKRFVHVSSVEAAGYGDGEHPRTEADEPHPDNNYGKSKLKAEELVLGKQWPMECVVCRLPMIYGPGTFLIVPKLFGFVKKGFYPLIGNGKSKMEFCYVGNAVSALFLAGVNKNAAGQLFYVSDERSYSIREVITSIAEAMEVKVRFIRIPVFAANSIAVCFEFAAKLFPFPPVVSKFSKKPFFTRETVMWTAKNYNTVSTEKIRTILGYHPAVSISSGCKCTAKWLKDHWDQQ